MCCDTTLPVTLLEVVAVLYLTCQLTYMLIVCSGRFVDIHVDLYHINASAVRAQVCFFRCPLGVVRLFEVAQAESRDQLNHVLQVYQSIQKCSVYNYHNKRCVSSRLRHRQQFICLHHICSTQRNSVLHSGWHCESIHQGCGLLQAAFE